MMKKLNYSIKKISMCFPAYNEEGNIADILNECLSLKKNSDFKWEFIVIDDGSKDRTEEIVKEYSERDNSIICYKHEKNMGYIAAFRTALQNATGDVVFVIDSDGQYELKEYTKFIDAIKNGFDFVSGYRKKISDSSHRVLLSRGYNFIFRMLFGTNYGDIDCAFKAFKKDITNGILKRIKSDRIPIGAEIFVGALSMNLKIKIVSVKHLKRKKGKTRIFFPWKLPMLVLKILYSMLKLKIESSDIK